jgi:hypothetical protein
MKIFNSVIISVHVWECTAASMQVISSFRGAVSPETSDGDRSSGFTRDICAKWRARTGPETREAEGLRLLDALDNANCKPARESGAVNCNLLAFIKAQCGGDFSPSRRFTRSLDPSSTARASEYDEKRVSGFYIGTATGDDASLKTAFDDFVSKSSAFKGSSIIKDTIQVDKGKQELTISAGTTTGDVSVFTHFTRETNSLYVILYIGATKSLEEGTKILNDFQVSSAGKIKSYMISTSREEKAEAKASEDATERMLQQNSQVASFALDLLCQASV